jgi:hypothetical protein
MNNFKFSSLHATSLKLANLAGLTGETLELVTPLVSDLGEQVCHPRTAEHAARRALQTAAQRICRRHAVWHECFSIRFSAPLRGFPCRFYTPFCRRKGE